MRFSADRGRVYRRCGCRDAHRHQLGTHCLRLTTDSDHGSWTFAVDLPSPDHHRATIRRGGFPTQDAARSALRRMLEGEAGGFTADPNQTVADYLATWLEAKAYVLKPTTVARYRDYVTHDLIPALGALKLDELGHRHIAAYAHTQLESGRGPVTVHRCLATLSSALGDAVRQHRLAHNPARPAVIPRPATPERRVWTPQEAVRFLGYCHDADPLIADLCELLIGTGMRKGEALGLHWACGNRYTLEDRERCARLVHLGSGGSTRPAPRRLGGLAHRLPWLARCRRVHLGQFCREQLGQREDRGRRQHLSGYAAYQMGRSGGMESPAKARMTAAISARGTRRPTS
ncbi:tyrosine-type recombinase/integrase [Streptomyces asiaticus]|uniref:tyrosine-type recombinase/integrase n=1 Tax=Streptomyces asiaticus TaxID=114695 RepID=UPI003D75D3CF